MKLRLSQGQFNTTARRLAIAQDVPISFSFPNIFSQGSMPHATHRCGMARPAARCYVAKGIVAAVSSPGVLCNECLHPSRDHALILVHRHHHSIYMYLL